MSKARPMKGLICCVCLGDMSETDDEIAECDNCGVIVHESCYDISDNQSAASTASSARTEPWFCDACKDGVKPTCEVCPNEGGIFTETDAGKWVHLVCALYTPGVAFGDEFDGGRIDFPLADVESLDKISLNSRFTKD